MTYEMKLVVHITSLPKAYADGWRLVTALVLDGGGREFYLEREVKE